VGCGVEGSDGSVVRCRGMGSGVGVGEKEVR
jgi:hypothetical protein